MVSVLFDPVRVSEVPQMLGGVSNGARTRDILDHNQTLYQLSYTHHATPHCASRSAVGLTQKGEAQPSRASSCLTNRRNS